MESGTTFLITPTNLGINVKGSGLIGKRKLDFHRGAGVEVHGCRNRHSALADVHHLAWYLRPIIEMDEDWGGEGTAKISPIVSNDQAQSSLQHASDQFVVEWLWDYKIRLDLPGHAGGRILDGKSHAIAVGGRKTDALDDLGHLTTQSDIDNDGLELPGMDKRRNGRKIRAGFHSNRELLH